MLQPAVKNLHIVAAFAWNMMNKNIRLLNELETVSQNLQLIYGRFTTISGHFFSNYMNIFHKSEVQMIILKCFTGVNSN